MELITDIESEIKRAEDFLSEGPNGSERMAVLSTIEELKRKLKNIRKENQNVN